MRCILQHLSQRLNMHFCAWIHQLWANEPLLPLLLKFAAFWKMSGFGDCTMASLSPQWLLLCRGHAGLPSPLKRLPFFAGAHHVPRPSLGDHWQTRMLLHCSEPPPRQGTPASRKTSKKDVPYQSKEQEKAGCALAGMSKAPYSPSL